MRKELLKLEQKTRILEPNAEKRKELLDQIGDYSDSFLDKLEDDLSFKPDITPNRKRLEIDTNTYALNDLIKVYSEEVDHPGLNPASAGHLGYIPGGGIYAGALGDYMASVSNQYAGLYFGGPGAVRLENRVLDWIKDICGYPETSLGNLASGGSIANLIAITSARDHHEISGSKVEKAVVYLSEHTHHCVHKALRIAGLGECILRNVELDNEFNIDPEKLAIQILKDKEQGFNPFLIVASAGTTNFGNIDPLDKIADIAKENKLWYHIDAAYGGFFVLLDELQDKFKGIERSDSIVLDPHKSMFIAYGLGAVLVKNKKAILHSNHYRASYLQDAAKNDQEYSPADLSPELTKHFRGLRLWLPLKMYGVQVFKDSLREKRMLCLYFLGEIKKMGFEVGPNPDLSVGIFRFAPDNADTNSYNLHLMDEIHNDGRVFLSSTKVGNEVWIRIAVLCFRTHLATIDLCLEMIKDCQERTTSHFKKKLTLIK